MCSLARTGPGTLDPWSWCQGPWAIVARTMLWASCVVGDGRSIGSAETEHASRTLSMLGRQAAPRVKPTAAMHREPITQSRANMEYRRGAVLLAILLAGPGHVLAQSGERTIIAAADPWPPYVDQKNPTDGLALEIIRAAFKTQGYAVKMEWVPWTRALDGVKSGKYDILPDAWIVEDQAKFLAYSEPLATNEIKFIKRKGDPFEFNGLESLKGKRIGIVKDYGYTDEFINSTLFTKDETTDLLTNVSKLAAGRVDLTLEDELVAKYRIEKENPPLLPQVEFTRNSLSSVGLHVAALKNAHGKEILDAFNRGLALVKGNGTYAQLFAKYGISVSSRSRK